MRYFSSSSIQSNLNLSNVFAKILFAKPFYFLGVFLLLFISCTPNTTSAADFSAPKNGGFVVVVQGLTAAELLVDFPAQKTTLESDIPLSIKVMNIDGTILYEQTTTSRIVDCSELFLPAGYYTLIVETETAAKIVSFTKRK